MVNSCSAYGCTTRWKKGVGFFKFPKDEIRRVQWMIAVRRSNWLPSASASLCYKHFQTGRPSKNENHPDYIPNVFVFNEDQTQTKRDDESYEGRKSWLEEYDRSKKESAERKSRRTKATVSPIESSGSDPDVPRDENPPLVVTPHVVVLKKPQTRRSAESYEERKSCQENYNGSESDADEPNYGRTEAVVSPSPSSGSDPHLPRCNKCLCKDAEIYFLQKEKEERLNEIKMLQLEVQMLREEIQKYKSKKR